MAGLLLSFIRFYRKRLSSAKRTPTCRFIPTCSLYAEQAVIRHGALRGGVLALWRVLRCNPFGRWGYDPVPETFTLFKRKEKRP